MVNILMRGGGGGGGGAEEVATTMSRSFLTSKYSHCPLKKRPVPIMHIIVKDEPFVKIEQTYDNDLSDDNSEPENLSTKPEDLSRKGLLLRTAPPSPTLDLISANKKLCKTTDSTACALRSPLSRGFTHFLAKTTGGPLEPLNLNTSMVESGDTSSMLSHGGGGGSDNYRWPRAVPAHYPASHYIGDGPGTTVAINCHGSVFAGQSHKQSTDTLPSYYYSPPHTLSPPHSTIGGSGDSILYLQPDRATSPPRTAFTPVRSHVSVIASVGGPRQPAPPQPAFVTSTHSPLSPSSTTSSSSYPPYFPVADHHRRHSPPTASPEDLSSSSGGSSICGNVVDPCCVAAKKKRCHTAPRYQCHFCSKSYSTYSGLTKHKEFHCPLNKDSTTKTKFTCKSCGKEYNSLGALKMHIRTHTLPCKCDTCGKAFSRPWLLQGHIRTHTGEKPFSCHYCNRAFADRSNLRAHLQTHTDVKKYSCPTCSKTFSRMSLLSKHTDGGCPGNATSPTIKYDTNPASATSEYYT